MSSPAFTAITLFQMVTQRQTGEVHWAHWWIELYLMLGRKQKLNNIENIAILHAFDNPVYYTYITNTNWPRLTISQIE